MNKATVGLIIAIIVAVIVVIIVRNPGATNDLSTNETSPLETTDNETVDENTSEEVKVSAEDASAEPGTYTEYSPEIVSVANKGDLVLFFHATWCPSCRALDNDINDSLSEIPTELTIAKLDYDSETELKKKYGVTTQHTLVQIDGNGDMVTKWSGGNTLESITSSVE